MRIYPDMMRVFHEILWKAQADTTANTAWQEHVATLDVAREYWG